MKHYKIFGNSLPKGVQNVGYSDVMMELLGIVVHYLAMSPYSSHIKDVLDELTPMINSTALDLINGIVNDSNNVTCTYTNGSHGTFNVCVAEISLGSAGVLLHFVELIVVIAVLKVGKERNVNKCKLWVRITMILTCLETMFILASMYLKVDGKLISYLIAKVIYKCYSCGLVSAYVTEASRYTDLPAHQSSSGNNENISTSESSQETCKP